jgi:hypothetical protein
VESRLVVVGRGQEKFLDNIENFIVVFLARVKESPIFSAVLIDESRARRS